MIIDKLLTRKQGFRGQKGRNKAFSAVIAKVFKKPKSGPFLKEKKPRHIPVQKLSQEPTMVYHKKCDKFILSDSYDIELTRV